MKYFVDTEYDWHPKEGRIVPISIGIVAEDGREFYALTTDYIPGRCSPFVEGHVLPFVTADVGYVPIHNNRPVIAGLIRKFIGPDCPEFWGDYAAFDYVVLSMVMGEFADWPQGWPMHINDCRQEVVPELPSAVPHHALADARAIRDSWNAAFAEADRR